MPYQHIINMYRSYTIRIHPIYLNFFKAFCCHSISFPCYYYTAILYDWPYNLRLQYYERLPIFSTPVRLYERRIQCRNGNILFLKVPGMPASPPRCSRSMGSASNLQVFMITWVNWESKAGNWSP